MDDGGTPSVIQHQEFHLLVTSQLCRELTKWKKVRQERYYQNKAKNEILYAFFLRSECQFLWEPAVGNNVRQIRLELQGRGGLYYVWYLSEVESKVDGESQRDGKLDDYVSLRLAFNAAIDVKAMRESIEPNLLLSGESVGGATQRSR